MSLIVVIYNNIEKISLSAFLGNYKSLVFENLRVLKYNIIYYKNEL